ncbi:uncharacterized protein [Hoplias malabaricus]|uniref:uncharacterized protein n=1 Tax=Hoplias malabaricus TaxID=27720 RepID=UPI003462BB05
MSYSLEELCAMVNVSYEEVKNIHINRERNDGEGVENSAGIVKCMQRDFIQKEQDILNTSEEHNRSTKEAEGVFDSDSEVDENHLMKRKRGPANWKRNVQKRRRMEGKSYSGKQKDVGEVTRSARILGPGCTSEACKKSAKRFCHTFSEEERQRIFGNFWKNMNWEERRVFVSGLVDHTPVARKRSVSKDSRRLSTLSYHLSVDGERRRVCKKFFLSTLGLGEWSVAHWVQPGVPEQSGNQQAAGDEALASLQAFLRDLPKVPSHCGQPSSSKLYLEPMFQSMSELHNLYQRHSEEELQTTPLSGQILMDEINHLSRALHHPKKDQSETYCSNETGHVECEEWQHHSLIKTEACEEKEENDTDNEKTMLSCMDLQTLLLCQKLRASSIYYKTKLALHNLSLLNMINHSNSVWHRGDGRLPSNEFASSITHCLQQQQHDDEEE